MSETMAVIPEACPQCHRAPKMWRERPKYGSRELLWFACCKLLAGGLRIGAAVMSWNREVFRVKYEMAHR